MTLADFYCRLLFPMVVFLFHRSFFVEGNEQLRRYCIDDADGDFICTSDPLRIRQSKDFMAYKYAENPHILGRGVAQRIDGTPEEQKAIRDILRQMDNYFREEVLGKPEYELARMNCKNTNELCAFWTAIRECESNRIFMLHNCPATCRFCLLLNTNIGVER